MNTPRLAHFVWPLSPLQGATPAARQAGSAAFLAFVALALDSLLKN